MSSFDHRAARISAVVAAAAARDVPMLVGPWLGEIGYELLYWAPFVRWALTTHRVPSDRVLVISRGGTRAWYGAGRYRDVFSMISPAKLASERARMTNKQSARDDVFLSEIMGRAAAAEGFTDYTRLHPHLMYRLFRPYWDEEVAIDAILPFLIPARITPPPDRVVDQLPADYVAARFYFSRSFPDTPENRAFAHDVVVELSRRFPVVLVMNTTVVDDHMDAGCAPAGVTRIDASGDLATNLAIQTAIIGGARAFVATYGGLSYLGALSGVPTVAFYSRRKWKAAHLRTAQALFERGRCAPFSATPLPSAGVAAELVLAAMRRNETGA